MSEVMPDHPPSKPPSWETPIHPFTHPMAGSLPFKRPMRVMAHVSTSSSCVLLTLHLWPPFLLMRSALVLQLCAHITGRAVLCRRA